MEYLCPLCNGLERKIILCERCGEAMEDKGAIQEYLDDYSPYLDLEITRKLDGVSRDLCLHIFKCDRCGLDKRIAIGMVEY
ncbi:MAG: hypothetical protein PHS13_08310 [Firmicutes bacterium]|nr:hypothetical protein [Bacillota bacterium]MDD3851602.1 hypothetical protein [Bacillota bacterium]MDD4708233.1 hypothetical protein [Bacillota bacterium]